MEMALILLWGLINTILAFISYKKIKSDEKNLSFILAWAFLSGAFVWEDMFVFGILHALGSLLAFVLGGPEYWILFYLLFWIVRSAGETLYFFLQQFIEPKHHPHYIEHHFGTMRKIFGNISAQKCFILVQITMQSIMIISLFSLILFLRGWGN
jgi:hypothetical protein